MAQFPQIGIEPKPKKKEMDPSTALLTRMEQGLAQGQSPADLMSRMMMSFMLNQQTQQGRKGRKSSARSSASTDHSGSSHRERQRQRCRFWKGDESCGDAPSPAPTDQTSPRQRLQEIREGDHDRVGDPALDSSSMAGQTALGKFRGIYRCAIQTPLPANIYATVSTK